MNALPSNDWQLISKKQPAPGDIIACCAEHRDGGPMYWAGTVDVVIGPCVTMITRGERSETFVVTHDTLWMPLPHAAGIAVQSCTP